MWPVVEHGRFFYAYLNNNDDDLVKEHTEWLAFVFLLYLMISEYISYSRKKNNDINQLDPICLLVIHIYIISIIYLI